MTAASVAGMLAERMAQRLQLYRDCVASAARGAGVPHDRVEELGKAMRALGLPGFAFKRDVRAWAGWPAARGYRRAELLVLHPHLFDEPDAWVRERVDAAARRVR